MWGSDPLGEVRNLGVTTPWESFEEWLSQSSGRDA